MQPDSIKIADFGKANADPIDIGLSKKDSIDYNFFISPPAALEKTGDSAKDNRISIYPPQTHSRE